MRAMFQGLATKKILTWLACLAVLFGALAPALSHAPQMRTGGPLQDLCSTTGTRADAPGSTEPGIRAGQHCPYCTLHLPDLAPAPASCGSERSTEPPAAPRAPCFLAPHARHAWACANPRAPPQRS